MHLDDVVLGLLVFAGVADSTAGKRMQLENRALGNGQTAGPGVDKVQGLPISANLLFVAVAEQRLAKHDGANALLVHGNPFDAVRRHRAFDKGMLAKGLELLRRLVGEEFLFAHRRVTSARYQEVAAGMAGAFSANCRSVIMETLRRAFAS